MRDVSGLGNQPVKKFTCHLIEFKSSWPPDGEGVSLLHAGEDA